MATLSLVLALAPLSARPIQDTDTTATKSKRKSRKKAATDTTSTAAPAAAPAAAAPAAPAAPAASTTSAKKKAPTPTNNASDSDIASAKASGKVWVNTDTGVYHKGGQWYGKTKQGKFMTEDDAKKAGYHAAKAEIGAKKS
jgi:hypothetical protein